MTLTARIQEVQRRLGVPADGVIGDVTLTAIERAVDERDRLKGAGSAGGGGPIEGSQNAGSSNLGHPGANTGAFDRALSVILRHEGGFVNDPQDPGGMTNLGVTRAVWEAWTGRRATETDMRRLTPAMVSPVYRKNYWDKLRCNELPPALALCVFDFGVNAGPARAARYLQRLAATADDGQVGPATIAAVKAWVAGVGVAETVRQYQEARRAYYRQLSTFPRFGRGWLRRVDETESEALRMVK